MHRTTILIPDELQRKAEAWARKEGISLSELIRRKLSETVSEVEDPGLAGKSFFQRKPWTNQTPHDLAAHHDDYLYGSGVAGDSGSE